MILVRPPEGHLSSYPSYLPHIRHISPKIIQYTREFEESDKKDNKVRNFLDKYERVLYIS